MTKPKLEPLIRPNIFSDGFTQSELSTFGSCAQKWNWRYNQLLDKAGSFSIALMVGSAFHDAMEQFYLTKGERVNVATLQFEEHVIPSAADLVLLDYWNRVLPQMVNAYSIYYKNDHEQWNVEEIEEEVSVEFQGFRLRGKIDLRFAELKGNRYILDHKTSARLTRETVAGWDFRFQFMFYLWLKLKQNPKEKLTGYYINAVKKPELRIKKNESVPEFAQRCFEDMVQEPEKYFYRERFPIPADTMAHFEKSVVIPRLTIIRAIGDPKTPRQLAEGMLYNKNTDECQHYTGAPCPFIDLCRHGQQKMGFLYTRRDQKHMELEGE